MMANTRWRWAAGVLALAIAAGPARADPFHETTALPSLVVPDGGQPLRQVLADLRKAVPTFQYVLSIPPGMSPADEPRVPAMQLKDVTLGQFVQYLNQLHNGVTIGEITDTDQKARLYAVDITERPHANRNPLSGVSASDLDTGPLRPSERPQRRVAVSNLSDLVRPRAAFKTGGGDHFKQATDDVLSAVQAALDLADLPGPPATIRIHQPTLTLMVRGTEEQLSLVQQTLSSLKPTAAEQQAAADRNLQALNTAYRNRNAVVAELEDRVKSLTIKNDVLHEHVLKLVEVVKTLQGRLGEPQTAAPATRPAR